MTATELLDDPAAAVATHDTRAALRRLLRPSVVLGGAILGALVVCAIAPGVLAPHDPQAVVGQELLPPTWDGGSSEFLLGTDQLGRDVLSRLIHGARTSLLIAGVAAVLAALIGTLVGLVSGYFGGLVDTALMRLADIQLAFPFIVLALALLAVTEEKTPARVIIVLAVADWVIHARVVRGRVLAEREKDYVRAAHALGSSHLRKMLRYILPTVLPTVIVIAMLEFATLMLVESILAFVGLGIDPPRVSWGTVMADGRENIAVAWWLLTFPGAAIFLAVLSVNLLADGLADLLDPRLKITGRYGRSRRGRQADRGGPAGVAARARPAVDAALAVRNLTVEFPRSSGQPLVAVRDVSFELARGERIGVVGESGSGKSVTALAVMGLLDEPGRITSGSVTVGGEELIGRSERSKRAIRGAKIAMVFQDPATALNPSLKVGYQVAEAIRLHQHVRGREARSRAVEALRLVHIPDPIRVARSYPFELSGGMQQRAMIAMALSCRPAVLLADEPTTALDVTTQAQILRELDALTTQLGTAIVLISHDLGVVAEFTERTIVMYGGVICEEGPTSKVVSDPKHPYTRALVAAVEAVDARSEASSQSAPAADTPVGDIAEPRREQGCPYASSCPFVMDRCNTDLPALRFADDERPVACHLYPLEAKLEAAR